MQYMQRQLCQGSLWRTVCVCARSCPTLCHPMDYSLPAPLSLEILWARILEWVAISSWKGNRQEGQGSPNGGKRLQVPDIFISLKRQEETNQRYVFPSPYKFKRRFLLKCCCHAPDLTTLKAWVNQCISFSYGNVVLSYVNVPQTLSSSWFCEMA